MLARPAAAADAVGAPALTGVGRVLAGAARLVLALLRTLVAALAGMMVAGLLLILSDLAGAGWPPGLRDAPLLLAGLVAAALALPGDLRRAGLLRPRRPPR